MSLDLKRKKLELQRVSVAAEELKFKIEERLDEIQRLEQHIKIQETSIEKLNNEIKTLEEKEK